MCCEKEMSELEVQIQEIVYRADALNTWLLIEWNMGIFVAEHQHDH